jgi:CRP-like cAMP-binding protein
MNTSKSAIEIVSFQPGEILFHENEMTFHFYIVQSGKVEVFKTDSDGKKVILAIIEEGSSIGEFALIDKQPRSASARALTAVELARISDEAYQQLLTELPDWATAVLEGLIDRIRRANETIQMLQNQLNQKKPRV